MSKVKMKREELVKFYVAFKEFDQSVEPKFSFFITRNLQHLTDEFESAKAAEQATHPKPQFQEFQQKHLTLVREYVEFGTDGNPLIDATTRFIFKDGVGQVFEEKVDELTNLYTEDIALQEKAYDSLVEIMQEEIEIEVLQIPYSLFPSTVHLGHDIHNLFTKYFCKDSMEDIEKYIMSSIES
jgi:hypothetical protein